MAGLPVYLDLEDDVLLAISELAKPGAPEARAALTEVVGATLNFEGGASKVLEKHLALVVAWEFGSMVDPPLVLPLLALLSLAAEEMHESDGIAAHNFYTRLQELLGLSAEQLRLFEHAYRRRTRGIAASARLWSSLNDWLEHLEGNRGLPTAFALGHDHVGLPMSQALVRQADRDKFPPMFVAYGLAPHGSLPAPEMVRIIEEWVSRVPCPVSHSLERLWTRDPAARERIADVACLALESWDGTASDPENTQTHQELDLVRAKALLRRFPSRSLEVGLLVPALSGAEPVTASVLDSAGDDIGAIDLVPNTAGWLGLADQRDIDVASFLDGQTILQLPTHTEPLRRRPRRLVPMRRDDMVSAYVECERVQLGEDAVLLVREEIATRVELLLDAVARPGFERYDALAGLPAGWALFEGVQILSSIAEDQLRGQLADLNLLQPLARSQVVLEGGLRLPGHLRKWSSALPPELRVSSADSSSLTALITCTRPLINPPPEDQEMMSDEPVLIWDLAKALLGDGDYAISVLDDEGKTTRREVLRLRSADHPALNLDGAVRVANDPSIAGFGLFPTRTASDGAFTGVPEAIGEALPERPTPGAAHWFAARSTPAGPRTPLTITFAEAHADSCMVQGNHYMLIDGAREGQANVEGVCKHCGLVKRYPTRFRQRRARARNAPRIAPRVAVNDLDPVKSPISVNWAAGFDAVCHVGEGQSSAMRRIALQMEPSELFTDTFERRLDVLGHVEIERDPASLSRVAWQVVDPTLVGIDGDTFVVIGFRNESMLVALEDAAWKAGGDLNTDQHVDAPPVIKISGVPHEQLEVLVRTIEDTTARPVAISTHAAESLAGQLPPLSQALGGLPITSMTQARSYERWNPTAARFEAASDAGRPGAYRLSGFARAYIYRRAEDIGSMTALLGDARVVKYAAALQANESLIGYNAAASVLYVPLGADLPGLYGRAAVLASGYPPHENTTESTLEYRDVTPRLAGQLAHLLMS
jgi:hypothetical protein